MNPDSKLAERLARAGVREEDLMETFARSGGPGGQNVNTTSSAVILVHRPSGIQVRCEQERSQAQNRVLARELLLEKIETKRRAAAAAARAQIEKIRRQRRKRPRAVQERVLEAKARRADRKRSR